MRYFQKRGLMRRPLLDPSNGEVRILDRWLGHDKGKRIVRVRAGPRAESAHRWQSADAREPITVSRGYHFPYIVTDPEAWLATYRKFTEYPSHWERGASVSLPKQAWKEAAPHMTLAEAPTYFKRWIAVAHWRLIIPLLLGRVGRSIMVEDILRVASYFASVSQPREGTP